MAVSYGSGGQATAETGARVVGKLAALLGHIHMSGGPAAMDDSSNDSDSSGDEASRRRPSLTCQQCKKVVRRATEFYLDMSHGGSADWGGQLWGWCKDCTVPNFVKSSRDFKKGQKKLWEEHTLHRRAKRLRARVITWNHIRDKVEQAFPGITRKRLRDLTTKRCQAWCLCMVQGFNLMGPEGKKAAANISLGYLLELDHLCAEKQYVGSADAHALRAEEAQYLTSMLSGKLAISFLCRNIACLFYGLNSEWVECVEGGHFRCPKCGQKYQPWAERTERVNCQKVLSLIHPTTGEMVAVPMVWPASAEDGWFNKMVELEAHKMACPKDLVSFVTGAKEELASLIDRQQVPCHFQTMTWCSAIEYMFTYPRFPPSTYQKHKERGFRGSHLHLPDHMVPDEDGTERFVGLTQEQVGDCVTLFARLLCAAWSMRATYISPPDGMKEGHSNG